MTMIRQSLAHTLRRGASWLDRLAVRMLPPAKTERAVEHLAEDAPGDAAPAAGGPPAHWLQRAHRPAPAHWLARIRQQAPHLLRGDRLEETAWTTIIVPPVPGLAATEAPGQPAAVDPPAFRPPPAASAPPEPATSARRAPPLFRGRPLRLQPPTQVTPSAHDAPTWDPALPALRRDPAIGATSLDPAREQPSLDSTLAGLWQASAPVDPHGDATRSAPGRVAAAPAASWVSAIPGSDIGPAPTEPHQGWIRPEPDMGPASTGPRQAPTHPEPDMDPASTGPRPDPSHPEPGKGWASMEPRGDLARAVASRVSTIPVASEGSAPVRRHKGSVYAEPSEGSARTARHGESAHAEPGEGSARTARHGESVRPELSAGSTLSEYPTPYSLLPTPYSPLPPPTSPWPLLPDWPDLSEPEPNQDIHTWRHKQRLEHEQRGHLWNE